MDRHASINRIYRLVWSHVHKTWVVVAETARGRGKGANRKLLAVTVLAAAQLAHAGPTGGQVTNGSGAIRQSGTTTTINQSSQNLSLSWQSFNTDAGDTVNFVQPSASAIAVNRIFDTNGTQFMGKLNANGQVYLINPNGVLFGAGSQVNVGGLVASTLDLDDGALNGATRQFSGAGTGSIVNRGSVTAARGGYVAFIGNSVSNQGTIVAPAGSVALGAGSDVTLSFAGNSLVNMQVNKSTLDNLAENGGLIQADGGAVILTAGAKDAVLASVVNNTGIIQARTVDEVNGTIVLGGGAQSTATNNGTLDASGAGAGQQGGTVKVLGDNVTLAGGSKIDVSGDAGGGTAIVGGNFHGAGPERNALNTTVAAGAAIDADAVNSGNGGQVAVWSNDTTSFHGSISARGGAHGGDGGQVETSGHTLKVGATAVVDTSAANGTAGDWLLDPADITIGSVVDMGYAFPNIDVDSAALTNALNNGNVTIKTTGSGVGCTNVSCGSGSTGNGDIVVLDTIGSAVASADPDHTLHFVYWSANNYTLTLSAYRDIHFKYTDNYYSPAAGTNYSAGGGIDLSNNATGGNVVLKADNSGRGTGTVVMDRTDGWNYFALGSPSSTINIVYNPVSYSAPTDYGQYVWYMGSPSQVVAQMAVNLTANIASKTYDRSTTATYTGLATLGSLPAGISVNSGGAVASFDTKDVGSGKTVGITGVTLTGAGNAAYVVNGLDTLTGTITAAPLTVAGVTANNKTYNGSNAATLSGSASVSPLAGDAVTLSGSGSATFSDKNVGAGKSVTVGGYTLSGADAGNYSIVQPQNLVANISKADVTVTGASVQTKVYDGNQSATLSGNPSVAVFGSDQVSVQGGAAAFADKNAGSGKSVSVGGFYLSGTDAGNYNLIQPTGVTGAITKASLALTGLSADDRTYDGTNTATLSGSAHVTPIGGDVVAVAGSGSATFGDKNAGANKPVTVNGGFTLSGADAGNYSIVFPSNLQASIDKAGLLLSGLGVANKVYDGTTAATLTGSPGVTPIGSDVVALSGSGSAVFLDKNAGSGKHVSVGGYSLSGLDAGNYNLVAPGSLTADVAQADLAVTGVSVNSKTYDRTTTATLSGAPTVTAFGADAVSVSGLDSASAAFADKNAGTNKAVTVSGFTLGGADAANYNLVQPSGLHADIHQANLLLTGLAVADKVYDATSTATLSGSASVTPIAGDDVALSGTATAAFADKNAGTNKAVNVSGFTLSGADAGNYNLLQVGGLSASIARADLAVSGVGASNKVYDGTVAATLSGTAVVSAIGADAVTVSGSGAAAFVDKNAGAGKIVTATGFTLSGADAANYNVVQPTGLTASIAKADLAISGVTANNKTYDGTTAATLSGSATVAAFGSDAVTVSGSGNASFADKNAGSGKGVNVGGFTLSGADAANYNAVQPSGLTATIAKADLQLAGLAVSDKVYDGTVAATLSGSASITPIASDDVAVSGSASAAFADKNAGMNKAVNVSGFTLSGADAGNYNLLQVGGLSANIARADLAVSGVSASNKVYDGTTAATLSGTAVVSAIGADAVTVSGSGAAAFVDKNAGAGKIVTATGFTLSGADAVNYNVVQPTGLTASIAKVDLAIAGVTANNKTYDGTTAATLSGSATVAAFGNDIVKVGNAGVASFADKNAGSGKGVSVGGFTLSGADAANYNAVQPTGLTASIGKASLNVSGVSANGKVYDGTVGATLSGTATVNAVAGDAVALTGSATASFADKNSGSGKAVTVSGYSLAGADAGNYQLVQPAGLSADIAKAVLTVSGVSANGKTYDGTTAATLAGTAVVSAIAGDAVAVTGSGVASFADKNAGSAKRVTVGGYTLGGLDAANYSLVQPSGLSASITPATLSVSGIGAADKAFDGSTAATVSTAGVVFKGEASGDVVTVASTGAFADGAAGKDKIVKLSNVYAGADVGNYTIVDQTTAQASISQKPQQIDSTIAQVQSSVLASQASAQPALLNTSSTLVVSRSDDDGKGGGGSTNAPGSVINTALGFGPGAPKLQIQNGGMRLPALATGTIE